MIKKIFFSFLVLSMVVSFGGILPETAKASEVVSLSSVESGDLIRGESFSAVYYLGEDGFRYVFPNDKTYFTWYENFDSVKWLSDTDMGTIQIGGNVTYRPGVKMVKINSDAKTYAVGTNGALHWVTTEEVAKGLYGSEWNTMIDDIPDGFFSNYQTDSDWDLESASEFDVSYVKSLSPNINADKSLEEPSIVSITDEGYIPNGITVSAGAVIRFENDGSEKHTATAEDLSWGTGTIQPGGSFSRYFEEAGTYPFFDTYNESLSGAIYVQ